MDEWRWNLSPMHWRWIGIFGARIYQRGRKLDGVAVWVAPDISALAGSHKIPARAVDAGDGAQGARGAGGAR